MKIPSFKICAAQIKSYLGRSLELYKHARKGKRESAVPGSQEKNSEPNPEEVDGHSEGEEQVRSGSIHSARCPFEERWQHQGPVSGTGGTAHGTCQHASLTRGSALRLLLAARFYVFKRHPDSLASARFRCYVGPPHPCRFDVLFSRIQLVNTTHKGALREMPPPPVAPAHAP